jgi:hypothetical protein
MKKGGNVYNNNAFKMGEPLWLSGKVEKINEIKRSLPSLARATFFIMSSSLRLCKAMFTKKMMLQIWSLDSFVRQKVHFFN